MENGEKISKIISINGVKVKIELNKDEAKDFPKKLESYIKVKDEELTSISSRAIFF